MPGLQECILPGLAKVRKLSSKIVRTSNLKVATIRLVKKLIGIPFRRAVMIERGLVEKKL